MSKIGFWLIVVGLLVSGCRGPYSVVAGETTEFITSTEKRDNGSFVIWAMYDPGTAYCTLDENLYNEARRYRDLQIRVTFHYVGINSGDKEGANDITGGGCDREREGVQTLKLVSFSIPSSSTMPSATLRATKSAL